MVDVDDVVSGILAAGAHGESGCRYVLGGENLLFAEIFAAVSAVVGHRPFLVPVGRWLRSPMAAAAWLANRVLHSRFLTPQIVGDMFAFKYYSSARAESELGWTRRYTFSDSLERAWEFYRQEGLL